MRPLSGNGSGGLRAQSHAAQLLCFQALNGLALALDGLLQVLVKFRLIRRASIVVLNYSIYFYLPRRAQQLHRPQRRLAGAVGAWRRAQLVLGLLEQGLVDLSFHQSMYLPLYKLRVLGAASKPHTLESNAGSVGSGPA